MSEKVENQTEGKELAYSEEELAGLLANCKTCNSTCKNENVEIKKQLTKAKELIKEMLSILPKENIEGIYEITEEAEQFLNGEVEKPIESSVDHIIEQNEKEVGLNPDYFSGGW